MSTPIAPNSYKNAAERNLPALQANLSEGSAWYQFIQDNDNPARNNSPYYGPATQFLVDCFFDIAAANPGLREASPTPLARFRGADFVIHRYIGEFAVGPNKLITAAYDNSDLANLAVHKRRRRPLAHDRDHVLLGASVPFDDVARLAGGAVILLARQGIVDDSAELLTRSTGLQIVAGVHGNKTPELTEAFGQNYFDPSYFELSDDGTVSFTDRAIKIIKTVLSPVGCPSASIRQTPEGTVFQTYWGKIIDYLVADTDLSKIEDELRSQDDTTRPTIQVAPASMAHPYPKSVAPKTAKKPHPRASKRYTPPKGR